MANPCGHAKPRAPAGSRRGHGAATGWLELFSGLVGEVPRGLGSVLGVVGLMGPGRGGVAAEVAPLEGYFGEDADGGAAGGAQRDGLFVFGVVGGLGDGGEGDLEGLGIDHAEVREGRVHLVGGGLRQPVGALAGGRVSVWMRFLGGVGDDGEHGSSRYGWVGLGPSAVLVAPRRPACFQAVQLILSVSVFDGKLRMGRLLPLITRTGEGGRGGTVRSR